MEYFVLILWYWQITASNTLDTRNMLHSLLWNPLEPEVTRSLALVQDNVLYNFNKNVTDVFDGR